MTEQKHILNPEQWVESYGDSLYYFALKKVLSQKIAEDIVQDTFLAALKAKDKFKGQSTEKTWLFAILKNKVIDHFRKRSSQKVDHVSFQMPFQDGGVMYKHWKKDHGPDNWVVEDRDLQESDEFKKIFQYCLSLLPAKLASVFSLKVLEELESDEVCKELGISSSNFWVIMHRARLQLRACMEDKWINI